VPTANPQTDSTRRFSDRVNYYIRSRPRYPADLLQFCISELGLKAEDKIADIGSGTGFLSEHFLRNGNDVFGVEPNEPMRRAAERDLAQYPKFHSIAATAEQTTLPAGQFAFVVAGQAFHWFDAPRARAEFQRILKPGGQVILVWNEREKAGEFDPPMMPWCVNLKSTGTR
jgi:SAM-dependent methyltransferase